MKNTFMQKWESIKVSYQEHPKRFWIGGALLLLIVFMVATSGPKTKITVVPVAKTDLKQTVLATGQVTSQTDLDLSFSTSDAISTLPVSVGDKVYQGQVLATLDNRDEYAALAQAQAAVASAKASYQKVVDGSSSEQVAVAQASLDSAESNLARVQITQATLLMNAHRSLLNVDLTPVLSTTSSATAPTVTGTYSDDVEGTYTIVPHQTGSSNYFSYSGLESGTGILSTTTPQPIGKKGLFIQFPTNFMLNPEAVWVISLPNPKSTQYLTAYNAYQTAVQTRDSALATAQSQVNERRADLALKKAAARPAEIDAAEAGVLTAEAQLAAAQVAYDKTILRAPAAGTVVRIDTKIGERVDSQKKVMVLQDVTNLYVEANINETSIAKVAIGQGVSMTLDAFGPEKFFTGKIIHVDPSATTEDGIVNYKVKASIELSDDLKNAVRPGMNANMVITASQTPGVLAVPQAAVTTVSGVSTVNVITNVKRQKYESRTITTGAEGDGNLIEVKSGLVEGDSLALIAAK